MPTIPQLSKKILQPLQKRLNFWVVMSICCLLGLAFTQEKLHPAHALYLSMTEIELSADGTGNIEVKVFSDDLQNALRNYSSAYQPADLENFFDKNKGLAGQYFRTHLRLLLNEDTVKYQLVDYDIESNAHFITFHFTTPPDALSLSLEADFFMELFPTQNNVIKVNKAGEQYYYKFTKPSQTQILTWAR